MPLLNKKHPTQPAARPVHYASSNLAAFRKTVLLVQVEQMVPVDHVTNQIDDDRKIDILRLRHHEHVIESAGGISVDVFDKLIVNLMSQQIGRRYGGDVWPNVDDVRRILGYVPHRRGKRSEKSILAQKISDHERHNGGVDAAARSQSSIAGTVMMQNTLPPLASNDLLDCRRQNYSFAPASLKICTSSLCPASMATLSGVNVPEPLFVVT